MITSNVIMEVRDIPLSVLRKIPDFFGRPVAGIPGMDILSRAETLRFAFKGGSRGKVSWIRHMDQPTHSAESITVPFTYVNTHLVITGAVNGAPTHFILDTGAPGPMLDGQAARGLKLEMSEKAPRDARGFIGVTVSSRRSLPARLTLGGRTFDDVVFRVSDLPVFARMHVHGQNVGLLGNSFFARFAFFEIDFARRVATFVR